MGEDTSVERVARQGGCHAQTMSRRLDGERPLVMIDFGVQFAALWAVHSSQACPDIPDNEPVTGREVVMAGTI